MNKSEIKTLDCICFYKMPHLFVCNERSYDVVCVDEAIYWKQAWSRKSETHSEQMKQKENNNFVTWLINFMQRENIKKIRLIDWFKITLWLMQMFFNAINQNNVFFFLFIEIDTFHTFMRKKNCTNSSSSKFFCGINIHYYYFSAVISSNSM